MTSEVSLIRALLSALRFDNPAADAFEKLSDEDWKVLLALAERERISLTLGLRCRDQLPAWLAERLESDLDKNRQRSERLQSTFHQIAASLEQAGIEFAVLKGFTHAGDFVADISRRPQYDLDLLIDREQVLKARDVLAGLSYEPLGGFEEMPLDHLPVMIRKSNWKWRGDFFDVEMPFAVELHFQLWNPEVERLRLEGLDEFWRRREGAALALADRLGYACLHLMRHLLRGDAKLYHVYEIAYFLDRRADDESFWREWGKMHSASLRRLEAIVFALASKWFGCRIPAAIAKEVAELPPAVGLWMDRFALSVAEAKQAPNKNELWLHLSLLDSFGDQWAVAVRRLLPLKRPKAVLDPHTPNQEVTWRLRMARFLFSTKFAFKRLAHHLRAAIPTAVSGLQWLFALKGLDPQFLLFLLAAALFNFGLMIFFLLYNLLLLERGYREDLLGAIASAMSLGSIAGTIPAAFILRRLGVGKTIAFTFSGIAVVCVIRALALQPSLLIASAFAGGFLFASYAVTIAPAVAQWTTERARPLGFSMVFSFGIGIGILGNLAGGRLPGMLPQPALQNSVLIGAAIAGMGGIVALLLRSSPTVASARSYPRGRFLWAYLVAIFIWQAATGMINPFLTAYFAKVTHLSTPQIGSLFSLGQGAQVLAILLAPMVLRRLGIVKGIVSMQIATALAAVALALGPAGLLVAIPFAAFKAFEYMSEPGMGSMLMSNVEESERSGASAMNFFVTFAAHAIAAAFAGYAARNFGYPFVFSVAAALIVLAALAFRQISDRKSVTS